MNDEEALSYIKHLYESRRPLPRKEEELDFLKTFDYQTDTFIDTYGYFAASVAQNWHSQHLKHPTISLGDCVRAANRGLLLASYQYIKTQQSRRFLDFAVPFIEEELQNLK